MSTFDEIKRAVIEGEYEIIETLTKKVIDSGVLAQDIFSQGLIPAMEVVGNKMKSGEYFIPEVLMSVKTMKISSGLLKPLLTAGGITKPYGKVVLGTVVGDLHDIGKNLVAMMLEGAGFEVIDIGIDVPTEKFIDAVKENEAPLVGMSALLTSTMVHMRDVMEALKEAGIRDSVKVMIGGAPVGQRFCDDIGADG